MGHIIAMKPVVNVRRSPNTVGGILGNIKTGDQLKTVGSPINGAGTLEKWQQVVWPADQSLNAYVCLVLPGGGEVCRLVEDTSTFPPSDDYNRGYANGRKDTLETIAGFLKREME